MQYRVTPDQLRAAFSAPPAPVGCRHCGVAGACLCGQLQRVAAVAIAKLLAPTLTGVLRVGQGGLLYAARQAEWSGASSHHLFSLERAALGCAKTARNDGQTTLAAAFEELAQQARLAAHALPS